MNLPAEGLSSSICPRILRLSSSSLAFWLLSLLHCFFLARDSAFWIVKCPLYLLPSLPLLLVPRLMRRHPHFNKSTVVHNPSGSCRLFGYKHSSLGFPPPTHMTGSCLQQHIFIYIYNTFTTHLHLHAIGEFHRKLVRRRYDLPFCRVTLL